MEPDTHAKVQAINAGLVDAYYEGESISSIALRSGRNPSTVRKLVETDRKTNGARVRKRKPIDPRIMKDKKMISPHHGWIGLRMGRFRAERHHNPTVFGIMINTTRSRVLNMEIGAHDFTITELSNIAKCLDTSIEELMAPPKGVSRGRTSSSNPTVLVDVAEAASMQDG